MTSGPTTRSDLILPDILTEDVMKGFAGKLIFARSGAVTIAGGFGGGIDQVKNTVTVPYIEDGGEAEDLPEDGAITLKKLRQSSETSEVIRLGKGFSITKLAGVAKSTGRDIYDVAREQVQSAFVRGMETKVVARSVARATTSSMVYDGSAAIISPAVVVETLKLFGEELDDDQLAIWGMNPKVYWDAAQIVDSTGRTLYTDVQGGRLSQIGGAPVRMTARADLVIAGSPTLYNSLLMKRGSVVAWMNDTPSIDVVRDPTTDQDLLVANWYGVIHAYSTMANGTKPGVAVLKTR